MDDALNTLWLKLDRTVSVLNDDLQYRIKKDVRDLVELEIKRVKKLQLIEVQACQLRVNDIVFDPNKKTLHKISYVEKRTQCQFNIPKDNNEILVMYDEDDPTDYFDYFAELYIMVDIGEIVHINKRTIDGILTEEEMMSELMKDK